VERKFPGFLEMIAKKNLGCEELKQAIIASINWDVCNAPHRHLKRESDDGMNPVKQIVFKGERFDAMSVRRWREKVVEQQNA